MSDQFRRSQRKNKGIPPARYRQTPTKTNDELKRMSDKESEADNGNDGENNLNDNSLEVEQESPKSTDPPLSTVVAEVCKQFANMLQQELSVVLKQTAAEAIRSVQPRVHYTSNCNEPPTNATSLITQVAQPEPAALISSQMLPIQSPHLPCTQNLPTARNLQQVVQQQPEPAALISSQMLPIQSPYLPCTQNSPTLQQNSATMNNNSYSIHQQPNAQSSVHTNFLTGRAANNSNNDASPGSMFNNQVFTGQQPLVPSDSYSTFHVKTIDLPKFGGDPMDWPIFERSFIDTTSEFGYTNTRNIIRLRQALISSARSSVESLLPFPESVQMIMSTLKQNFGRPEQLINRNVADVRRMPAIQSGNYGALINFANKVRNLSGFMKYVHADHRLGDITLVTELVAKLPTDIQMQWAEYIETSGTASISNLSNFLDRIAARANSVQDSLNGAAGATTTRLEGARNHMKSIVKKHAFVANAECQSCLLCNADCKKLHMCPVFNNMTVKARWDKVKEEKLCFGCLKKGHGLGNCRAKVKCGIENCPKYHNRMLHNVTDNSAEQAITTEVYNAEAKASGSTVLFQIMPVVVNVNGKSISTYAFIDHGSSHSMIEWSLAETLGMSGEKSRLAMQWLGNLTTNSPSLKVDFTIQGTGSGMKQYRMTKVYTVNNLNLPSQTANVKGLKYTNAKPEIIIGLDHAHLTTAICKPSMQNSESPIIVKTRLGIVAYGKNSASHVNERRDDEDVFVAFSVKRRLHDLEQIVKEYFVNDDMIACSSEDMLMSKEETAAMQRMQETTRFVNGRYEVSLLWKNEKPSFPPTRDMALKRLYGVEAKMKSNKEFGRQYIAKIQDYIKKGYVRRLSRDEAAVEPEKTFYLPHFAVCNPNKKSLRIVFDAAAEVKGVSLNKALFAGPDLNQSMLSILFKFRQGPVAVCGDIKEMFLQIAVRKEDQDSQRFLWREHETDANVSTYCMQRMLFGATCSPTLAQYIKNLNAKTYENEHSRAAAAIINKHYVDDYVDCFSNPEEAIQVVENVISIHRKGGFELRNIFSNSQRVFRKFGSTEAASGLVTLDKIERVLGMYWDYVHDDFALVFHFHKVCRDVLTQKRAPTKREVLRLIMSVFDPYGLLGSFLITGKLFMQELWKLGLQWDETIPNNLQTKWKSWLSQLQCLTTVKVPRCYHYNFMKARVQLHVFADASESAMAAVAYFRIEMNETVTVRFVFSKTRCAPLKYVSIPRMELQAALMAIRMKDIVLSSHDVNVQRVVYWTDSTTVIAWLQSESRCFKQFVANRVSEIRERSDVSEWKWLPGSMNVADEGTRARYECSSSNSLWLIGPKFLTENEKSWPMQPGSYDDNHDGSELKAKPCMIIVEQNEKAIDFARFSKLIKLIRAVAWMQRFVKNCRSSSKNHRRVLSCEELNCAENLIHRLVQQSAFGTEYNDVVKSGKVKRSSCLVQLNPFSDEHGVLRIHGRLERATCMTAAEKRLVILPKCHEFTSLVVRHYHEKLHHINRDTIIAEIRSKYWIPSIRSAVKKCEVNCNTCKIRKAEPKQPIMGPLPKDRVTPYVRPFTYTGIDYFGPIMVTVKRGREKRWVALFTCLTTRAVHLELAADLSSDACLVCIRNFINRRGVPEQIRSDNGTNFKGIEKELNGATNFINNDSISEKCGQLGIRWVFNCPANPSEGGAWERLVQSIKKALAAILKEQAPRIETLISALIEAENIVNSRPLTHLPVEVDDEEPLTPNHFLLNTANSTQTPGEDSLQKLCTRKQWRIAQTLKNAFWKRWLHEYLPDLTRRTKWCSHDPENDLKLGDLVIICEASLPSSEWRRGRVLQLHTGSDGVVRSSEVQTQLGVLRRPVSKLAKLKIEHDGEAPVSPHGGENVAHNRSADACAIDSGSIDDN